MNNSKLNKTYRTAIMGIIGCAMFHSLVANAAEWASSTVSQPEKARYSGSVWVGGQLHEPYNSDIKIARGYASLTFRIFDHASGAETKLTASNCRYGGSGELTSDGQPQIITSGIVHELRIPIRAAPQQSNSYSSVGCEVQYNILADYVPEIRLINTKFERNDGVQPYHYFVNGYIKSDVMANGVTGNFLSSVGTWGGTTNIAGQAGVRAPLAGYVKVVEVPAGNLSVQYRRNVTLDPSENVLSETVIEMNGVGRAKAVWDTDKGGGTEIIMEDVATGGSWVRGQERDLSAGDKIRVRLSPSALNVWGTRTENVTVTWNIQ